MTVVAGKGEACQPVPEMFDSRLRSVVRYADPAAWLCAAAVARAVANAKETVASDHDKVGVVVVSDEGPQETMEALEKSAVAGFSSPLRFPAGNPGSLVGVTCILMGFRGPTMNLIMPPASGVPVALVLASGWLERRVCSSVVVTICSRSNARALRARSLLLSTGSTTGWDDADTAWLRFDRS